VSHSRLLLAVSESAVAGSFLALLLLSAPVAAQNPAGYPPHAPAAQATPTIAVIDMFKVFKNHAGFKNQMKVMDGDVKRAEETFKSRKEDFQERTKVLKTLTPGTPDYAQKEAELATLQSQLNVEFQLQQKQFQQREATTYYNAFLEVQAEIDVIARANGLAAVLQFSSERPHAEDVRQVARDLNKEVLWYDQRLDITDLVLQRVNGKYQANNDGTVRPDPLRR
jgi:Skp family chaperone for outer membrane proteins